MASAMIFGLDNVSGAPGWQARYGKRGFWHTKQLGHKSPLESVFSYPDWLSDVSVTGEDGSEALIWPEGQFQAPDGTYLTAVVYGSTPGVGMLARLAITDTDPHLISVFSLDNGEGRKYAASVWDYDMTTQLTPTIAGGYYTSGVWLRLVARGPVTLLLTETARGNGAILSQILFDDCPSNLIGLPSNLVGHGVF